VCVCIVLYVRLVCYVLVWCTSLVHLLRCTTCVSDVLRVSVYNVCGCGILRVCSCRHTEL